MVHCYERMNFNYGKLESTDHYKIIYLMTFLKVWEIIQIFKFLVNLNLELFSIYNS